MDTLVTAERLADALDFRSYFAATEENHDLWNAVYRTAVVPEGAVERARAIPGTWHLVALSEDWCGDAVNALPVLAKLVEQVPTLHLTILSRDANPDLMDSHLTGESRAIPVVIVYDEDFVERGWWGPRPRELQRWFVTEGQAFDKTERYKRIRTWYARDRGRSIVHEVLSVVEAGAAARAGERTDSTSHAFSD